MADAFTFEQVLKMISFFMTIWVVGWLLGLIKGAPLVGHIIFGIILGPNLLDYVPFYEAVMLFGEIGLMLLVFQAGLEVDLGMLKQLGLRAFTLAFFGSFIPMFLGVGLFSALGYDFKTSIAAGAALSPTSLGIAVETLSSANVLSTAPGQLITASAVIDDVIGLIILSMLEAVALENPSPLDFAIPIISSVVIMFVVGAIAIFIPTYISSFPGSPLQAIPYKYHKSITLFIALCCGFGLSAGAYFAKSSYLLGIFIAGLAFCTIHMVEEYWLKHVAPIMNWLLMAFFAGTIGFVVPIKTLFTPSVFGRGMLVFLTIIGKLATGLFARPFTVWNFFKIGLAMSAWGEIAFVIATVSKNNNLIDEELYASIILAVILSAIISPVLLKISLSLERRSQKKRQDDEKKDETKGIETAYWALIINCKSQWGLYDKLTQTAADHELEVVEARLKTDSKTGRINDQIVYRDISSHPEQPNRREKVLSSFKKAVNDSDASVTFTRYYQTKEFLSDVDDFVFVENFDEDEDSIDSNDKSNKSSDSEQEMEPSRSTKESDKLLVQKKNYGT